MAGKNKHKRFQENAEFACLVQPKFEEVFRTDHPLKGQWRSQFFKNDHPLILELGCGRGEYTVNLARKESRTNFIGFDIKGARLWRGAKSAEEEQLTNIGFVRTKIEFSASLFAPNEVDEIWITFPDPQPQKERKRLSGPWFWKLYQQFLKPGGIVHLKTDSAELYEYTNEMIKQHNLELLESDNDIYNSDIIQRYPDLNIQTTYEKIFLKENKKITYTKFKIDNFVFHK